MRDEENGIIVKLIDGASENEFNYIDLIEHLHSNKLLEEPEFIGDINEDEQKKLIEMLLTINEAAATSNISNIDADSSQDNAKVKEME